MNYYEHHIGDYAEATAHLSFVEDAAYSRLIRKYYAQEKPLPADLKAVQRLIGARTKEEKEAVQSVLDEFFLLEGDGWHNKRCDEEIGRYQEKQRKAKASAEARWSKPRAQSEGKANAMRTHTENDANALDGNDANAMRTHCEGNAHQTPDTNHQTPNIKDVNTSVDTSQVVDAGESGRQTHSPGEISKAMRAAGIMTQPANPMVIALAEQGVSLETIRAACVTAREAKPNESIGVAYVVAILQNWAKKAAEINAQGARPPSQPTTKQDQRAAAAASIGLGAPSHDDHNTIDGEARIIG